MTPPTDIGGIFQDPNGKATDNFTMVANLVTRDPKLTLGAKGLFSNLTGHAPGFRITEQVINRQCADSMYIIRKHIAELCAHGYLYRGPRERYPAGTTDRTGKSLGGKLGPHTYYVTDKPEVIAQILAQNQREQDDEQAAGE